MHRSVLSGLIAVALLAAPATAATAAPPSPAGTTGRLLQEQLDAVHTAGMPGVFAEVRDGRRTWTPTAGYADVVAGTPVRDGMRHRIGSVTKTFVATTVLQLAGERKIDLDAPVGRYLPRLVPADLSRTVTVRMLLNHTSGIGNYTNSLIQDYDDILTMGQTVYAPEELARIGLAMPVTNPPGGTWNYSNTNYILAGLIIEKVTGHSYRGEISRRILRPLGLDDTYFEGAEPDIRGPHMNAYVPWPDGTLRDLSSYNMTWGWAAGEIVSTGHDLNVFYRALLTGKLLSKRLLTQMQTTVDQFPGQPELGGYGLGIYWVDLPCGRFWGHDGGTIGHVTVSWHSADARRQLSYAQSMTFYDLPAADETRADFLLTAACGPQQATTRSAGPVLAPRTPDLTF